MLAGYRSRKNVFAALIALVTFVTFLPSLQNKFISTWDDGMYVLDNPKVAGLSVSGVKDIFTSFHRGLYKPLVILSFAVEHHFFGFEPGFFHLTNLLLHVVNALLVFAFFLFLSQSAGTALMTALLFAVHPMHAESVLWISERKDLLYTMFFFGSLLAYCRYARDGGRSPYSWSVALFILSLLSKPMGILLPVLLFVCDRWFGRPLDKRRLLEKLPFAAVAAAAAALSFYGTEKAGTLRPLEYFSHWQNIQISGYALASYLVKAVYPAHLSAVYPYPMLTLAGLPLVYVNAPAIFPAAALILFFLRRARAAFFGASFFLLCILPALPCFFVNTASMISDHYTYAAYAGLFFIFAHYATALYARLKDRRLKAAAAASFAVLIVFSSMAARERVKVWHDGVSLWTDVLEKNPYSLRALYSRAGSYREAGLMREAEKDYDKLLGLKPDYAPALLSRALLRAARGDRTAAMKDCSLAVRLRPDLLSVPCAKAVSAPGTGAPPAAPSGD